MPQSARYTTASASTFQFLGVFFISTPAILFPGAISGLFNAAFLAFRSYYLPDQLQFITEFNQITTSTILMLLAFLQLKYQGIKDIKDSPFCTHPIVMNIAVCSASIHLFAYGAMLRFPLGRLAFVAHRLLVSSGYIAVAALSSIVLPDAAVPFVYAIFGLFSAAELLIWLHCKLGEHEAELWFQIWRIRPLFSNIFGNLGNFNGQRQRQRQRKRMPRLQV